MSGEVFTNFIDKVGKIADALQEGEQFVSPVFIQDFTDKCRRTKEHATEIMNVNRELKIGIVGQVKAGKSSFLNALVFDGHDFLPKAATPMTAALTKISYSQNPRAKIVFYTHRDWEVIEKISEKYDSELDRLISEWKNNKKVALQKEKPLNAKSYATPEPTEEDLAELKKKILLQYRACKELTEMAKNNEGVLSKLDSEEEVSLSNLEIDLAQYVGANGLYTPIVKYIELFINNEMVKEIQIVDTPGLGDPIRSRSEKTKEFLMACDVVFLLSQTSQFMKSEDIELIMTTLPGEGINQAVLVGSQFDSAMLDDSARGRQPLKAVLRRTRDKFNARALQALSDSRKAEKGYVYGKVLDNMLTNVKKQIETERSLYYTAAILHNSARKIECNEPLNVEEEHSLTQMENRFEGMNRDPAFLREFADIDRLRDKEFVKIRREKDKILLERSRTFAKDQAQALQRQLNAIQIEGEQNLRLIQSEDINSLQEKMRTTQEAVSAMRRDIKNTFESCAIDVKNYMVGMALDVKARAGGHKDINISEETQMHPRSETTGMLFWKKTHRWTETEHYKVANLVDAINNINGFVLDAENAIKEGMHQAIDIATVRNSIKEVVIRAFQKADATYEAKDIVGPVEAVLKKLVIPEFSVVDRQKYHKEILDKFPNAQVKAGTGVGGNSQRH